MMRLAIHDDFLPCLHLVHMYVQVDLFLSENNFTSIPQAVLGMTQLAKLSIACCSINEVPDGLSNVSTLKFLDLSFNNLTCLPGTLSKLTQLNALNVSFNPLNSFPEVGWVFVDWVLKGSSGTMSCACRSCTC